MKASAPSASTGSSRKHGTAVVPKSTTKPASGAKLLPQKTAAPAGTRPPGKLVAKASAAAAPQAAPKPAPKPTPAKPAASKPAAPKPAATKPTATKPVANKTAVAKAVPAKGVAAKPSPAKPTPPAVPTPAKPVSKKIEPSTPTPAKPAPAKAADPVKTPAKAAAGGSQASAPPAPKPPAAKPAPVAAKGLAEEQVPFDTAPAAPKAAEPSPRLMEAPRPGQMQMQNGRPMPPSRAAAKEENFVEGDFVVYPTHGVGKVEKIAIEDIAGHRLELIHITFEENRMTLRVPVTKARTAGLRKLATRKMFDEALAVLKGRARIKRTMWSRRAQEYEAKINSGDPMAIAEVVRDLHRNAGQPDQSFSERQIYEAAMDRLAAELAALDLTDKLTAINKLGDFLKTV